MCARIVRILVFSITLAGSIPGSAQSEVRPFFSSVVVSDIEAATQWYTSVLKVPVKIRENNDTYGYKLAILENTNLGIELMELKGALSQKNILKNELQDTKVMGFFKLGFKVENMDAWIAHLKTLNIKIDKVWKDDKTGKRNFMINDPDGNIIQFFD